ncbi:MAG TPA: DUF2460 domain-containing protein [Terriglobales bacterium]|nr:DUF2460 domain-containing protein [Terriglobales bacterium]
MAFIEVQFPDELALMATGGPAYNTTINPAFSGYEQRNANWPLSRASWDVSFEHKTAAEYDALLAMFHAAQGSANGFRLFDPTDYKVTGGYIGTGNGVKTQFQLQKIYTFPVSQYQMTRPIQKPITSLVLDFEGNALTDTVKVYDNGVEKPHNTGYGHGSPPNSDYTLDYTTGIITFASPVTNGHIITADFQFHWPVRFNLDQMKVSNELPNDQTPMLTVTGISLQEVRIKLGSSAG